MPFDIWYDLGIVGAGALATALYAAVRAAGRAHAGLVPGAMAAFATAFTLCCLGVTDRIARSPGCSRATSSTVAVPTTFTE